MQPCALPSNTSAPLRLSSTLMLVRDSAAGPEMLMVLRAEKGDQNSGIWVFPGGLVDQGDTLVAASTGLDDARASARLGLGAGGLAHLVAAVRECFEEAGLLIIGDATGQPLPLSPEQAAAMTAWRRDIHRGDRSLAELCQALGAVLLLEQLHFVSHWITPHGLPKRFDSRFFLAAAPVGQVASHDNLEMIDHRWIRPADALAGQFGVKVIGPARALLQQLSHFEEAQAMLAWARELEAVPCIRPRLARLGGSSKLGPVLPHHPAWPELGCIDPWGQGLGSDVIEPERVVTLAPGLLRITADNGSVMTGPGTNTYLLRTGADNHWAVIDPGPDDARHVDAILAAAPGPIQWILVTHTHIDHSPAAARLKALTGAQLLGCVCAHDEWQDASFIPDLALSGGEQLVLGPELTLEVIHTPGHASNHLCYLHSQERVLFTGDHVMQGSTVVINPPDGVMADYLASLQALAGRAEAFDWIAPGHGFLIPEPHRALTGLTEHRLRREARVVQALLRLGPNSAEALLATVYDDVHPARHPVALRSLLAHLHHLNAQARVLEAGGVWQLCQPGAPATPSNEA